MAKRKPKPSISLNRARDIIQAVYFSATPCATPGEVSGDSADEFARLRDAVARQIDPVPVPDWARSEPVPGAATVTSWRPSAPPPAAASAPPSDDSWDDSVDPRRGPAPKAVAVVWTSGDLRETLGVALDGLPESSPILGRMLRADDAVGDFLALGRWCSALAWYWGVDASGYGRAVWRHWVDWRVACARGEARCA